MLSGVLADEGRGSREVLRGMGLNVGMRSRKPRRATLKQFQIASQWQAKGIQQRREILLPNGGFEDRKRCEGAVGLSLLLKEPMV